MEQSTPTENNQTPYPMGTVYQQRSDEKDQKALERAKKSLGKIEGRRKTKDQERDEVYDDDEDIEMHDLPEDGETLTSMQPTSAPSIELQMRYDEKAEWQLDEEARKAGAIRYAWSGVGFPGDESICIENFESQTHIDNEDFLVKQLGQDILDIKNIPAGKIADGQLVETQIDIERKIEQFALHKRSVVKITFQGASISSANYGKLHLSKNFEKQVDKGVPPLPSVEVEQYLACEILLRTGSDIGCRTNYLWRNARRLAQQQIHLDPTLEEEVEKRLKAESYKAFQEMLDIAKTAIPRASSKSYHQARRNQYAVDHNLFYHIKKVDILMVLDKDGDVIYFQLWSALGKLLSTQVEQKSIDSFEKYSTLAPGPLPDATRHGLHWTDWLKEHPEFDFRNPANDLRLAKSCVYHLGGHCATGDGQGKKGVHPTADSSWRIADWPHVQRQQEILRYNALGGLTETLRFLFERLDPELLKQYEAVALEVAKQGKIPFQTRRGMIIDPFVTKAILVDLHTTEHKDISDWNRGFAALVPLGAFEGGDLLIRQLGLRIEGPSGCAQFTRGKELFHSITKWTGRRFVVVHVTHQAVRVSSENKMKAILGIGPSSDEGGRKRAREDSGDDDGGGEKGKNPKKSR